MSVHRVCSLFRIFRTNHGLPQFVLYVFLLMTVAFAPAQNITGTATNGTTNKPAAGDEVVLIKLAQGMEEVDRTKTDSKGNFSFKQKDPGTPYLLRVIHQGVTYHRMAPPGTTSVELQVYDVSKKITDLNVTADVIRLQAESGSVQVVRRFAVNNSSSPPRTQMSDQNFEFYLPDGAQIDSGMAKTASGQPVNSAPVPQKEKNRYAFIFPLRPGQTELQVGFHMPYSGSISIDPKPIYPTQHLVVVVPKSIQFSSESSSGFQVMQDPGQSNTLVQVATNTQLGQSLVFKVSGTGTLPASGESEATSAQPRGPMGSTHSRPGGGPPNDPSSAFDSFRWFLLGGFAIVLVAMTLYLRHRSQTAVASFPSEIQVSVPTQSAEASPSKLPVPARSGLLFQALKEELFQLEVEHKQGRISQEEYSKAKEALDQTLERAIKRESKA